jgi:general secretion pathway protein L
MKSVGLDIGSNSIKVVEVQASSKGTSINSYEIKILNQNLNVDQDLEVIEYLREVASRYDHSQTLFCVALRQDRVAVRNKTFPFNDRLKIAKTLPIELEEDIPFSVENSIFDSKIICSRGATAEVLACAAPKHHLVKLLQILSDSGIQPQVVSSEGAALANIYESWNEPPPQLPAIAESAPPLERNLNVVLQIGHQRTLVCFFENSNLVAIKSLLWGGKNIAETIMKKYEVPFLEALKELELKAFILTTKQDTSFDAKIFSDTIAKSVREMVRDLQLCFLEVKSELNAQIQRVEISGGVSLIQGLTPFLTQMLEVPVNRSRWIESQPQVLFEKTDITDSRLGVALGLAYEGLKKPRNPAINFLKHEFARQNHLLKNLWNQWGITVQLSAAILLIFYIWTFLRTDLSSQLVDRAQEALKTQAKNVAGLTGKNASERNIKKYIIDNKKRVSDLKKAQGLYQMNSAIEIMKKLSEVMPDKKYAQIDVKKFAVVDNKLTIEGVASSLTAVGHVRQSLSSLATDGKVTPLSSSILTPANKTVFAFSINVDREVQKVGL